MIYAIVRQSDQKEWILENPTFVRYNEREENYLVSPEATAHAVMIEGTAYHILGRKSIKGLEDVTLGTCEGTVYTNVEVKEKLDGLTSADSMVSTDLDDLWVAVLEG